MVPAGGSFHKSAWTGQKLIGTRTFFETARLGASGPLGDFIKAKEHQHFVKRRVAQGSRWRTKLSASLVANSAKVVSGILAECYENEFPGAGADATAAGDDDFTT